MGGSRFQGRERHDRLRPMRCGVVEVRLYPSFVVWLLLTALRRLRPQGLDEHTQWRPTYVGSEQARALEVWCEPKSILDSGSPVDYQLQRNAPVIAFGLSIAWRSPQSCLTTASLVHLTATFGFGTFAPLTNHSSASIMCKLSVPLRSRPATPTPFRP